MDGKKKCKFCADLAKIKSKNATASEKRTDEPMQIEKYEAAFVDSAYRVVGEKRYFAGRNTYGTYRLRYCPSCGRKIK